MALRWLIASLATVGMFLLAWAVFAMGEADLDVTLSLAGLLSSVLGGPMFWWAGREALHRPKPAPDPSPILVGEIPQRPSAFQPRRDLYRRLTDARSGRGTLIQTLTGARGVGKTQLAAAYARQCIAEQWSVVAWINADEPGHVLSGLAQFGEELGLRGPTDHAEQAAWKVRRWLETEAPDCCLVVFDNAGYPDELRRRLPASGRAQVVITSSDRAFENLATSVDVGVFTEDEALALLGERTGLQDEAGARLLAAEIGYLPIALAQSAAVIRRQALTYETFLRRLLDLPIDEYLAPLPGDPYPHGAAHAALLSIVAASRDHPMSRPLAEMLSVLAPSGVDRDLLYAVARDGLRPGDGPAAPHQVDEGLAVLRESFCLITFSVDGHAVIMHRFTQRVIRDCARRTGELAAVIARAARLLTDSLIPVGQAWARRAEGGHLVQQITALCGSAGVCQPRHGAIQCELRRHGGRAESVPSLLNLRRWAVQHLIAVSNFSGAVELGDKALAEHENLLGMGHPDTLEMIDWLATAHQKAKNVSVAVPLFERSLAERENTLPPGDPATVASRHRLACAYLEAGRVAEAIPLVEQVIADRERLLGVDHPDTLSSREKLAYALQKASRFDESIALYMRILADRCRILGPDDPATATSRGRLAYAHQLAGHLDEAITLLGQAVTDRVRILGSDHPGTLEFRNDLAAALHYAGHDTDAVTVFEQTLAESARALGADHPLTRAVSRNLADVRGALRREASITG